MAIPVEMPKMSDTMEEGVLVSWLVEEGASVSAGDVIAQVETDKATMDLEVWDDGVLLKKAVAEGEAVPLGGLIAVLGEKDEDISTLLARYQGDGASTKEAAPPEATPSATSSTEAPAEQPAAAPAPAARDDGRIKSSPLARRLASDHGVDLGSVRGSGPEGRIIKRDIEALLGKPQEARPAEPARPAPAVQQPAPAVVDGQYEVIRISQMRKAIARRLSESKFTAPHFYLTRDLDIERAIASRERLNALAADQGRVKVSFNDLVTKACAHALREHPAVNASWMEKEGEIRLHRRVDIAIAVAIDEGLITPVIRNADQKGLSQISAETRALAEKARNKQLQPEEFSNSTFTTSNLGMFGIEEFTAIINPPNACILAIGAIRDVPVVKDGAVVPGKRMKVTLSCDHRVVDGATGAQFLATVAHYLEEPLNLLL